MKKGKESQAVPRAEPVSLSPLGVESALAAMLAIKPGAMAEALASKKVDNKAKPAKGDKKK